MCNCDFILPAYRGLPAKEVDGFYLQITTENRPEYGKYIQSISSQKEDDGVFGYHSLFQLIFEFTNNRDYAAFIEKDNFTQLDADYISKELGKKGLQFQAIAVKAIAI